jgi:polygalacturonase
MSIQSKLSKCSAKSANQIARSTQSVIESLEQRQLMSGTFLITSYGASTSSADNSGAIMSAFAAANKAGGGTVEVTAGTFLSQPFKVTYSNVTLNIESGGVLEAVSEATYSSSSSKFIEFEDGSNVALTGPGEINGNGAGWWSYDTRPAMIAFSKDTGVTISNITLINSAKEFLTFDGANNVTINNVTINAPSTSPNTDGIDPAGSNYTIENCNISTGDDDIAVKPMDYNCNNITITNCTIGYGHGISVGGGSLDGCSNVTVNNVTMNGTAFGIRLKSNQGNGGTVTNCTYSNITMTNVGTPIEITSWYGSNSTSPNSNPADPETVTNSASNSTTPIFENISFSNITATGATHAGDIFGMPQEAISNVTFSDVKIASTGTGFDCFYATGVSFTNGSTITCSSGVAVTTWDATLTGLTSTLY